MYFICVHAYFHEKLEICGEKPSLVVITQAKGHFDRVRIMGLLQEQGWNLIFKHRTSTLVITKYANSFCLQNRNTLHEVNHLSKRPLLEVKDKIKRSWLNYLKMQ